MKTIEFFYFTAMQFEGGVTKHATGTIELVPGTHTREHAFQAVEATLRRKNPTPFSITAFDVQRNAL